jgi:endoglucanase
MIKFSAVLLPFLLGAASLAPAQITLNEKEYFEGPGFFFLTFHNNYMPGYQGGLQMVQNGERILDSGDLYVRLKDGREHPRLILRRTVDRAAGTATVHGKLDGSETGFRLVTRSDGRRIMVHLELDASFDRANVAEAGFRIHLYPAASFSRSYQGETGVGVFPRQYTGRPLLLSGAQTLRIAQEDPAYAVTLARTDGTLALNDRRESSPQRWFTVEAPLAAGANSLEVTITPALDPEWRRPPVIGVSQVGYHPKQKKAAVIELDERDKGEGMAQLVRLELDGAKRTVKKGAVKEWGRFHRFRYATFDFSEVREPGVYLLRFRDEQAGPFRIGDDVLDEAWRPALQYFMPIQMCHVQVREGSRVWHGACHLDDAIQAPAGRKHLDGYEQAERETKYADNEHVPGLDWGGWHDAGDHDIPAGSVAQTVNALALAYEEFRPDIDLTTIRRETREVELHVPDGRNDLVQQVEYGVEWLLATYRAAGHILPGVVETTGRAYGHLGDMMSVTDNLIYDPSLKATKRTATHSGRFDDRWVFTNRNTGLQYMTAQTLAIASRVLREENPRLAGECLEVAGRLWTEEQSLPSVYARSAYTPRDSGFRSQEIAAAAELLLTTGDEKYRQHLLSMLPAIEKIDGQRFGSGPGWVLARAAQKVSDGRFTAAVKRLAADWRKIAAEREGRSPYGVHYPEEVLDPGYKLESRSGIHSGFVWGHGWNLQSAAMRHYYLHKHMPELFTAAPVFATVDYVLGRHPATNESLVSGVGARSPTIAYGFNRADWSHIPGGVISGTSLVKPDYLELKTFPFLWYQTEYVIHGAATYIFGVLAAQKLAGRSLASP